MMITLFYTKKKLIESYCIHFKQSNLSMSSCKSSFFTKPRDKKGLENQNVPSNVLVFTNNCYSSFSLLFPVLKGKTKNYLCQIFQYLCKNSHVEPSFKVLLPSSCSGMFSPTFPLIVACMDDAGHRYLHKTEIGIF